MVRDTARGFAQDYLMPRVVAAYRDETYDPHMLPEMGKLGLLGPTVPEEYGGAGLGYVSYGLIAREMERVDSRLPLGHVGAVVAGDVSDLRLWQRGAAAQISAQAGDGRTDRLLRPDRAGSRLRSGLDGRPARRRSPAASSSTAPRPGSPTRRSPTWRWCGPSSMASSAASSSSAARKGFSTPKIEGKLHLRASITGEIVLEDCVIPEDNLLPNVKGLAGPFGCLNNARYGIAWGAMGAAEFCWHRGAAIRARPQAVRPPARRQSADPEEARRHADRDRARLQGALRLGRMLEAGKAAPPSISLMKRNNCGKALDIARLARDMHGGNGISEEYHVMRVLSNLETVNTYEGTHDIHALILGRAQTGIQAFF